MFHYYKDCQSLDEARSLYRKLALENHPDHGGDLRIMQEINRQWAEYQVIGAKMDARQRQEKAHAEGKRSAADYHDLDELGEILRAKVEALLNISPELVVEVCGLWVWVTGETKKHHAAIKAVEGMRYAPDKEAWYFAAVPSYNRTCHSMTEIRSLHGSQVFSRQPKDEEPTRQGLHA
jgi:hypothetical protein